MLSLEIVETWEKDNLAAYIPTLAEEDIRCLVGGLAEKDDNLRYKCFLLLQGRSQAYPDVYPYWEQFVAKLADANSYQRSLGLMMIAENARWDTDGKFEKCLPAYLAGCTDEKFITARQCIQGLCKIVPYHPTCYQAVIQCLTAIDLMQRKDTQRKLLLLDILSVLRLIHKAQPDERIARYFLNALTGEILDSKSKKLFKDI
jgi:hypothetical protein